MHKPVSPTMADFLKDYCSQLSTVTQLPLDRFLTNLNMTSGNILSVDSFLASLPADDLNICHSVGSSESEDHSLDQFDPSDEHNFILSFNFWMLCVLMPLIAIFGIMANAASIVVLTRRIMRSSTINIYLAGLSGFDSLLLLMSVLLYPSLSLCEMDSNDPSSPWCRYFFYSALFTYPVSLIMQSCSVWTLTAITVDRFIAITWPLRSRKWCTCERAYTVLASIALWSIVYNLPAFFELKLKIIHHPLRLHEEGLYPAADNNSHLAFSTGGNLSSSSSSFASGSAYSSSSSFASASSSSSSHVETMESYFVLDKTDLRQQPVYQLAYKGYFYLFFMLLIPAGAMVILNLIVSIKVRRAYKWRSTMSGKEEKERRCTIMAVLVVVTFLVFNSLAFVNNMIEIFSLNDENAVKSVPYLVSVSIGNVLVALNSATNFVIYCALGLRFRIMFCKIFCMSKCLIASKTNSRVLLSNGQMGRHDQSIRLRYCPVGNSDTRYSPKGHAEKRLMKFELTRHMDSSYADTSVTCAARRREIPV